MRQSGRGARGCVWRDVSRAPVCGSFEYNKSRVANTDGTVVSCFRAERPISTAASILVPLYHPSSRQVPSAPSLREVAAMPCAGGKLFTHLRGIGWSVSNADSDAKLSKNLKRLWPTCSKSQAAWSKPFPNLVWAGVPAPAPAPAPATATAPAPALVPAAAAFADSAEPAPTPASIPGPAPVPTPACVYACAHGRVRVARAESESRCPARARAGLPPCDDAELVVGRHHGRHADRAAREGQRESRDGRAAACRGCGSSRARRSARGRCSRARRRARDRAFRGAS